VTQTHSAAAVLVAAGNSTRMGAGERKPFRALVGRSILEHACAAFDACPGVSALVLVVHKDDVERVRELCTRSAALAKVRAVVPGGAQRSDSVRLGVAAVPAECELVLVHDAARALVRPATIEAALDTAARLGSALVAVPVRDTLKSAPDGRCAQATVDRSSLWAAQTPQVFRTRELASLLERAQAESFSPTDDAALHERYIGPVPLVRGDDTNLKITTPDDLEIAEAILSRRAREQDA
jgi:2-C-methyl-D-erythritol 4-phosphate cytidylyltransferase